MSVYSRFFGSPIVQIIVNVFNSLIYSYTTVEYRLEQFTKTCSYYKTKYNYDKSQFPNSNALFESIISLPIYPSLSDESVKHIIDSIIEFSTLFAK